VPTGLGDIARKGYVWIWIGGVCALTVGKAKNATGIESIRSKIVVAIILFLLVFTLFLCLFNKYFCSPILCGV
jgi:hypothetical protein